MTRKSLGFIVTVFFIALASAAQSQEPYPSRTIRVIVPFAAGGGTDALARIVAQKLSAKFGQSVIVENRAGGAGNIGAEAVFRSSPDGHTLLFTQPAPLTVNAALYGRSPFEAESFVPIAMVSVQDIMLAVNPNVPAKDLAELIAYAKANPNKLNYGSSGVGTAPHLAAELFKLKTNIDMVHVPYKGSAESMMATLGGQIDLTFFAFSSALTNARSGKLRAVAVGGQHRNPALPELPSISETVPGYNAASWTAMVAPPGTPLDVAQRLRQAMIEIKEQPDVQARMVEAGDQVFNASPSQMADFLMEERRRWSDLIKLAGIKAQ